MGLPMLIYLSLSSREFLQQSIRATFDGGLLWGLPASDLAFSIS
jgi:hypothetical protein